MGNTNAFNWKQLRNLFFILLLGVLLTPLLIVVYFAFTYHPVAEARKPTPKETSSDQTQTSDNQNGSGSQNQQAKLVLIDNSSTSESDSDNSQPPPSSQTQPPPPPAAQPAQTYTVTVSSNGTIAPSSLTIKVGDIVNFVYTNPGDEVILTFSPKPPTDIKLDHEDTQRSYTFSTAGTYTYSKKDGGVTQASIVVQ